MASRSSMLSAENPGTSPTTKSRISAIDALRGLVIILMALDHSRDFFGDLRIRPENVETTTTALFFTRWVTHFCAPTFLFLAGVSAWIVGQRRESKTELAWFLVSRGIWLLILEFTVIRFGLLFALTLGPWMFIVIASIGSSMILLGLCCFLSRNTVLAIGILIVAGHNLLDGIQANEMGAIGAFWTLFLRPGYISQINLAVGYPILPWFGIMALGYGLGPFLSQPAPHRRRFALCCGLAMLAAFLLLRSVDIYGDGQKWSVQKTTQTTSSESDPDSDGDDTQIDAGRSLFSFLTTSKYPPSLLFVLMTLGPSLIMLALFDYLGGENLLIRFLTVFGSVPLFFYVLHFYLLHLGAWGLYDPKRCIDLTHAH